MDMMKEILIRRFKNAQFKTDFDLQKAYDVGIFNNPKIKVESQQ